MIKNVVSILDGAVGSCGKAKVVGEIATDKSINLGASVTNCMPNAGHTFVDELGNATVFRNIPVSAVNPKTELFIGPGSAIDMEVFMAEYERVKKYLGDRKIYVHEMVPIIEERHKAYEREHIKSGSTFKGCGAVTQEKVIRYPVLGFFKGYKNAVVVSGDEWLDRLYSHLDNPQEYVLLEGAQGCDLCLNHSGNYPYVTSRNVSTMQMMADSGISGERLLQTNMVIRPFPIRISNITESGKYIYTGKYGNGEELTWAQINLASMFDSYPCRGDVDCYNNYLDIAKVRKLVSHCPKVYLMQLFGENYKSQRLDEISLLQALELERLVYKSKGISEYQTKLIELPMIDAKFPENTIFDQSEDTTVTRKERKVYDLDIKKLKKNCQINTPYNLYLNFFQHLSWDSKGETGDFDINDFNHYLREYLNWLESETKSYIAALGTGPQNGERLLRRRLVKDIQIV